MVNQSHVAVNLVEGGYKLISLGDNLATYSCVLATGFASWLAPAGYTGREDHT